MDCAKKQTQFEIYGAIFNGSMPKSLCQILNQEEEEAPLFSGIERRTIKKDVIKDKDWWEMSHSYFLVGNWDMIFPFIISAPCIQLRLYDNEYSKILMDISRPNFYTLSSLSLARNNISSIEQLQFIEMPFLDALFLEHNKISKVSALNKCAWNHLSCLDLSQNQISTHEIARLKISEGLKDQSSGNEKLQLHIWTPLECVYVLPKLNFSFVSGFFQINPISPLSQCMKRKALQFQEQE